jgi:hypothetical protein
VAGSRQVRGMGAAWYVIGLPETACGRPAVGDNLFQIASQVDMIIECTVEGAIL